MTVLEEDYRQETRVGTWGGEGGGAGPQQKAQNPARSEGRGWGASGGRRRLFAKPPTSSLSCRLLANADKE